MMRKYSFNWLAKIRNLSGSTIVRGQTFVPPVALVCRSLFVAEWDEFDVSGSATTH